MGVEPLVFEPCASRPAHGDFLDVLDAGIEELARAIPRD
jgi:hypothetical protein